MLPDLSMLPGIEQDSRPLLTYRAGEHHSATIQAWKLPLRPRPGSEVGMSCEIDAMETIGRRACRCAGEKFRRALQGQDKTW